MKRRNVMARRTLKPDRRPSWMDPDLPVIREYRMANGTVKTEVDSNYEQRYRAHMMQASEQPDWRSDSTYNARKKR